jgi:hypothetical protein
VQVTATSVEELLLLDYPCCSQGTFLFCVRRASGRRGDIQAAALGRIGHRPRQTPKELARMEEDCMPISTVSAHADLEERRYICTLGGRGKG